MFGGKLPPCPPLDRTLVTVVMIGRRKREGEEERERKIEREKGREEREMQD